MPIACQRCRKDVSMNNSALSVNSCFGNVSMKVVCVDCIKEVLEFAKPTLRSPVTRRAGEVTRPLPKAPELAPEPTPEPEPEPEPEPDAAKTETLELKEEGG